MAESLRERQRASTRQIIQDHALRLFLEQGFDATPVSQVASAAGVSSMTVFRHFATKEDLVLADDFDPVIVTSIVAVPADQRPIRRIGQGLVRALAELPVADRATLLTKLRLILSTPALRARQWDTQYLTQRAVVDALTAPGDEADQAFALWVATGVCLAAVSAALVRWAESDGLSDLDRLVAQAVDVVLGS